MLFFLAQEIMLQNITAISKSIIGKIAKEISLEKYNLMSMYSFKMQSGAIYDDHEPELFCIYKN